MRGSNILAPPLVVRIYYTSKAKRFYSETHQAEGGNLYNSHMNVTFAILLTSAFTALVNICVDGLK